MGVGQIDGHRVEQHGAFRLVRLVRFAEPMAVVLHNHLRDRRLRLLHPLVAFAFQTDEPACVQRRDRDRFPVRLENRLRFRNLAFDVPFRHGAVRLVMRIAFVDGTGHRHKMRLRTEIRPPQADLLDVRQRADRDQRRLVRFLQRGDDRVDAVEIDGARIHRQIIVRRPAQLLEIGGVDGAVQADGDRHVRPAEPRQHLRDAFRPQQRIARRRADQLQIQFGGVHDHAQRPRVIDVADNIRVENHILRGLPHGDAGAQQQCR